jgi:AcrR family transcriptional regulator
MTLPDDIAEAATRLVKRHGPDGFTMDDLARESGLSRATLYRQAGSRDTVLAALAERGVELGDRADMQKRILAACRQVFTRAGFEAATVEEIAAEAGVGAATVYRQFGDKAGLIRAFADHVGPRRAMQETTLSPSGDLRADLERVATTVMRYAAEDIDLLKLAFLEKLRGGPSAELLQRSPFRSEAALTRLLRHHAESGQLGSEDPRRMARAFIGMLFAFFARPLLEGGSVPDPEETARFVTHVFLDGLSSASPRRR